MLMLLSMQTREITSPPQFLQSLQIKRVCFSSFFFFCFVLFCFRDTKPHEDKLIQLQVKVDKLEVLLGNSDDERAR